MTGDELSTRLRELKHMAGLILAMLDREVAQYADVEVTIEEWASTAFTDGIRIVLPYHFQGVSVFDVGLEFGALGVGLLVHEAGHFLQPLDAIRALTNQDCPHWLANLALDIQGEALIASLSPNLGAALVVPRALCANVSRDNLNQYNASAPFVEQALCAILAARFANRDLPFDPTAVQTQLGSRMKALLGEMDCFREMAAKEIPGQLRKLLRKFPELRENKVKPNDMAFPSQGAGDANGEQSQITKRLGDLLATASRVARAPQVSGEALKSLAVLAQIIPKQSVVPKSHQVSWKEEAPNEAAENLARQMALRFETPSGAIRVLGADQFQLHEALRGFFPFAETIAHPSGQWPKANVVLCVDTSASMNEQHKREKARIAAQAVCLAVQRNGGDVRAVVFDDALYHARDFSPDILFANQWPTDEGTSFVWLTQLWQAFPKHRFVLLTDGEGQMPNWIQPTDRARSAGLVIPSGDAKQLAQICGETLELDALELLPSLLNTLVPLTGYRG